MFHKARKYTIAVFQRALYFEYIPALTGAPLRGYLTPDEDEYLGYQPTLDPSITTVFNIVLR